MKASSHNLNFSIHCFDFRCASETQRTITGKFMKKIQIVSRRFRTRLHASNFGIQFLVTLEFSFHNFLKTIVKIFDAEFPYKRSYFEPLCLPAKRAVADAQVHCLCISVHAMLHEYLLSIVEFSLCFTSFLPLHSIFLKLDRNTSSGGWVLPIFEW